MSSTVIAQLLTAYQQPYLVSMPKRWREKKGSIHKLDNWMWKGEVEMMMRDGCLSLVVGSTAKSEQRSAPRLIGQTEISSTADWPDCAADSFG